ncbi:MAG: T9SS type A sorting domain-containing protein [Ignavibacteria bacterium]|nr:T9SS type A sorting domain-containing protein [Ignavibacteria bacterium]
MKIFISFITVIVFLSVLTGSSIDKKDEYSGSQNIVTHFSKNKNRISQKISAMKSTGEFKQIKLFIFEKEASENDKSSSFVAKSSQLKLDDKSSSKILKDKDENILFTIPVSENNSVEIELTRSFPVSPDFVLKNKISGSIETGNYKEGLHYQGIIKGKENSTAAISIFENFVMGLISDETGNYVLGPVKNSDNTYSDNYIFYNDADLTAVNNFKCGVEYNEEKFILPVKELNENIQNGSLDNPARLPVKVYFEADYAMYLAAESNVEVLVNFITGMFNQVMTIYENESIPFVISGIGYWSGQDPYAGLDDSYLILTRFGGNNRDDFEGNIAHLLSTRDAGLGGIAWIRVLCYEFNQADSSGRFAFSNIDPNFENYPTYSWTVNVVAHEMGHSLGSRHTHACVWPVCGIIRAIDSCYYSEGGCFANHQISPRVGTIMSYCHLWTAAQGGGINLASGFGPLPGDTIRLRYAQAACLDQVLNSSEQPSAFSLKQNFPNPYNPSTTITFALPVDANVNLKVYDVTGKLVSDLILNKFYLTGFYNVNFNSENYNLSSGIYFYSLESDGTLIDTKRMVLIK